MRLKPQACPHACCLPVPVFLTLCVTILTMSCCFHPVKARCQNCLRCYNESKLLPRVLPCKHVLCSDCIRKLADQVSTPWQVPATTACLCGCWCSMMQC